MACSCLLSVCLSSCMFSASTFYWLFIMSGRGGKALTLMAAVAISWYTGVKFWQPMVVYVP